MYVDGRGPGEPVFGGWEELGLPQEAAEEALTAGCLPSVEGTGRRGFAAAADTVT